MNAPLVVAAILCLSLAVADLYQAITGRRLSKRPSRRTIETMRRQSAVAAVLLAAMGVSALVMAFVTRNS